MHKSLYRLEAAEADFCDEPGSELPGSGGWRALGSTSKVQSRSPLKGIESQGFP